MAYLNFSKIPVAIVFVCFAAKSTCAQKRDYPIQPVAFTHVHVHDAFWSPKMELNANVTIPYTLQKCEQNGRVKNFLDAASKTSHNAESEYPFDDTDIYKVIEGASYALQLKANPELEKQIDSLIRDIAAAQEPDGYLYTFRTMQPTKPHPWIGTKRWEKEEELSHELYNSGHLYEAAFAHYQATGKKTLLNIALKNADLLVKDFGWGKEEKYPGHQVVEIGLVKLYRITSNKKYLDLAKFFLDVRGPKGDAYNQADKKVIDQHEAEGHAVRATYMYTGMADIAALTGDTSYLNAIDDIWNDVVGKKIYITGGIGATGNGEAFGDPYQLPNMSAYAETCAAIANVYWNSRMFQLHGDSKYMDVLERTLYNGLLSGISLSGNRFFYPNPLASIGQHERSAWFSCACCISNMTRFLPSVPGYVYAQNGNNLYVNLFMTNSATVQLPATKVGIEQATDYPWEGKIDLTINPAKSAAFTVMVRIPGWAVNKPVPGELYRYSDNSSTLVVISINGKPQHVVIEKGYAVLKKLWKKGDQITVELPMETHKVIANEKVKDDVGHFALQRGPLVYCLEAPDNKDGLVQNILVDKTAPVQAVFRQGFLANVNVLTTEGVGTKRQLNSPALITTKQRVTAIPYYAWNNRGAGEMMVWIPYEASAAKPMPAPTVASTSTASASIKSKALFSINDQLLPDSSSDHAVTYFHWWPKNNSTEWVKYDFDSAHTVSKSKVYWFDDGPWGGCRIPASYKIYYKKGDEWLPVKAKTPYAIAKDTFNLIEFEPVSTTALKLEVQLPVDNSTGIYEWAVE